MRIPTRSEEHTSELQSLRHLVCRLLLEKKKNKHLQRATTVHFSITGDAPYATTGGTARSDAGRTRPSRQVCFSPLWVFIFFFNDTATTEIYTLSLHDALPISGPAAPAALAAASPAGQRFRERN